MTVVTMERRGSTALLTLNRPEARNAVSPEVSQAMAGFLDEIEEDDGRERIDESESEAAPAAID